MRLQPREPRRLERGIVVSVEIVHAHNIVPALEQPLCDVHADKTCTAGDQDFQRHSSSAFIDQTVHSERARRIVPARDGMEPAAATMPRCAGSCWSRLPRSGMWFTTCLWPPM